MRICYFGIYDPDFGRNKTYLEGLKKLGHEIIECRDVSPGLLKFWRLFKKHHAIKSNYDFMIVGYPGHVVVPLAKCLSKKPVVADLLGSLEDAEYYSHSNSFLRRIKNKIIDRLAVWFADAILLESQAQKEFFENRFGKSDKYEVVYTGASKEFANFKREDKKQNDIFWVVFRGKLTPESGITYILKAAEILKNNQNIKFKIVGWGYLLRETEKYVVEQNLTNVIIDATRYPKLDSLALQLSKAHISLGQFEDNRRLNRTIPHKAFESLALGLPYLTGDAPAVREIIQTGETGFVAPLANPKALAEKIFFLFKNPELLARVGMNGRKNFDDRFVSTKLAKKIIDIMERIK